MSVTADSISAMRELTNVLSKFFPTFTVVESNDTDGNPVTTISADATPAFGEKVMVIRMKAQATPDAKDIFGNAQLSYSRHVYQLCTEANYEGSNNGVLDILTPAELSPVLMEIGKRGSMFEWYQSANGTVPSTAEMVAGNLKGSHSDLYWNTLASI